jgi:hypothetical protein
MGDDVKEQEPCGQCSKCASGELQRVDCAKIAQAAVAVVREGAASQQYVTAALLVQILRGNVNPKTKPFVTSPTQGCKHFGAAADLPVRQCSVLVHQLLARGLLVEFQSVSPKAPAGRKPAKRVSSDKPLRRVLHLAQGPHAAQVTQDAFSFALCVRAPAPGQQKSRKMNVSADEAADEKKMPVPIAEPLLQAHPEVQFFPVKPLLPETNRVGLQKALTRVRDEVGPL